ncbi:GntR family transcriptional regulator [Amycolatopsis taiwanensis]|uniref:GntR family transcriptional regulator n=1 Tax=Amycolatopsis taiwanensis TaxID=342230 RepID=A0A9W6R3F4_9PSEU|nr:GntR family transcriptional regulator [Amycolatopsis taiwanensis]GLY68131.1 GntR family transcriptional regulator [Amycolatopsis taiwanensis]
MAQNGVKTPGTITDFVTEHIRNRIVLGVLKPGHKVPVYELADELGVSRVPLREAVRQLEAESLVHNLPRRGTVVRELSAADLRDTFEILHHIEPIAARRATEPGNEEIVAQMRYWLGQMQELAKKRVPFVSEEMLHAHREFHFALFRAAGEGGVLERHLCMLWNACERYVMNSLPNRKRQAAAAREHAQLVELIEAGDPDGAAEVLHQHLDHSLAGAMGYLEANGISA